LARKDADMNFRRIMIALDSETLGTDVLAAGGELARCTGAEVALVSVADVRGIAVSETSPPVQVTAAKLREDAQVLLQQAAGQLGGPLARPAVLLVKEGLPERELAAAAHDWHADLLVMGTHGRTGLAHLLKRSVAEWVLHHAPCPVLVLKIGSCGA
jgi:nucleotide-binding universal stress UspA family protein